MARHWLVILTALFSSIASASQAATLTYTSITRPGAAHTLLKAVSGSHIVGSSVTAQGVSEPFLANGPMITPFTFPGIPFSRPEDIEGTLIAGNYSNPLGAGLGFFTDGTSFWTDIDYPGGLGTSVYGVSGGRVAGYYVESDDPQIIFRGFVSDGVNYTRIDPPGSTSTMVFGIDGNRIVGTYSDASFTQHGFIFDGSTFTTIDFPGAYGTRLIDLSGPLMVGTYYDQSVKEHSFLFDGTTFTEIAFTDPAITQPISTRVEGIEGDRIVGFWHNELSGPGQEFQTFGFIATVAVPEPSAVLLVLPALAVLRRRRVRN